MIKSPLQLSFRFGRVCLVYSKLHKHWRPFELFDCSLNLEDLGLELSVPRIQGLRTISVGHGQGVESRIKVILDLLELVDRPAPLVLGDLATADWCSCLVLS